ncbi:MAG: (2Fe-2S)-binding protein [Pseudomonadales bacterium]
MIRVSLKVNGMIRQVEAAPETPLIFVLRDKLNLNGPRYGCGSEHCGACVVHIDGNPAFSCTVPVETTQGKEITTVEGLGTASQLHPLQQAFLEFNAAQCGYCASGIIMAAAALLKANPTPSRTEIQVALKNHLCRCGAHNRIISAISRAAELMPAQLPASTDHGNA